MRRLLALALVATACGSGGEPAPVPTTESPPPVSAAPTTTAAESPSGVLSLQLGRWDALRPSDYDFEYVLEREGGTDSGTYRAEVRDGEAVNCYLDGALSMRIECDPEYYTIESLFDRLIFGDVRDATVIYHPEWHFPAEIDHRLRPDIGEPYRLEVVAFAPQEPVDWVAFVADAVDWLEANYAGDTDVVGQTLVGAEATAGQRGGGDERGYRGS